MSSWLLPDYIFPTYRSVTPEFLKSIGVKALLIDIDNTLAPYEMPDPDVNIITWFGDLLSNGISATLVSNNDRERVERFNKDLGLPAYYKSGKPFSKNLKKAMESMGSDRTNTAMLGDQLLTDAAAGKHIGIKKVKKDIALITSDECSSEETYGHDHGQNLQKFHFEFPPE